MVTRSPSLPVTVEPPGMVTEPSSLGVTGWPLGGVMVVVPSPVSMTTLPPSSGVTAPVPGSIVPPSGRVILGPSPVWTVEPSGMVMEPSSLG